MIKFWLILSTVLGSFFGFLLSLIFPISISIIGGILAFGAIIIAGNIAWGAKIREDTEDRRK